jgi:hypothetical protein
MPEITAPARTAEASIQEIDMTSEAKKQELMEREESREVAPATDSSAALIQVIERATTNPAVDVEKMERLYQMHERITAKQAEMAFHQALTAAQKEMRPITADATNPQTRSRYATYANLDSRLRPIYSAHGFCLSFDTAPSEGETVKVLCHVSHEQGHSRTHSAVIPADGKGAKGGDVMTKTHATGAAMSYGMRYLLKMIFNVAVGEDDTDGNRPRDTRKLRDDPEKLSIIEDLLNESGADRDKFLNWAFAGMDRGDVEDIPVSVFDRCRDKLRQKLEGAK